MRNKNRRNVGYETLENRKLLAADVGISFMADDTSSFSPAAEVAQMSGDQFESADQFGSNFVEMLAFDQTFAMEAMGSSLPTSAFEFDAQAFAGMTGGGFQGGNTDNFEMMPFDMVGEGLTESNMLFADSMADASFIFDMPASGQFEMSGLGSFEGLDQMPGFVSNGNAMEFFVSSPFETADWGVFEWSPESGDGFSSQIPTEWFSGEFELVDESVLSDVGEIDVVAIDSDFEEGDLVEGEPNSGDEAVIESLDVSEVDGEFTDAVLVEGADAGDDSDTDVDESVLSDVGDIDVVAIDSDFEEGDLVEGEPNSGDEAVIEFIDGSSLEFTEAILLDGISGFDANTKANEANEFLGQSFEGFADVVFTSDASDAGPVLFDLDRYFNFSDLDFSSFNQSQNDQYDTDTERVHETALVANDANTESEGMNFLPDFWHSESDYSSETYLGFMDSIMEEPVGFVDFFVDSAAEYTLF